jgi:proline iminopeptidase
MNGSNGEGTIAVPGGHVYWRRFGSGGGLPLLVIHGGPGIPSHYLEPLAALGDWHPVFMWDQLDCGRSDCPRNPALWTLERFVEELDRVRTALTPGPVHVLGHSWGATLAMEWLITLRPAAIASVIFASPCLSTPRWIEDCRALVAQLSHEAQAAIAEAERSGEFRTPGYHAAAWGEWMHAHIVRRLNPEQVESLIGSFANMNANLAMLEHMWGPSDFTVTGTLKSFDRTADLGALTMPVLFHCGEFDDARPETVREQAALTPNAEVAIIAGAGHLTMIDAPEHANQAIRNFLARVEESCKRGRNEMNTRIAGMPVLALAAAFQAVLGSSPLVAQDQQQATTSPHGQLPAQGAAQVKPAVSPVTLDADGKLTVIAARANLRAVLNEISTRTRVPIVVADSLDSEPVSIELREVRLDDAMKRLLSPYDAFYLFSGADKARAAITSIWVYPRGQGHELEPVPPSTWASTKELEAQLESPDPSVRAETYEALIERLGDRGLATISRAFIDPDEGVRLGALQAALGADLEIPAWELQGLVLSDPSQAVRLTAIMAIEDRPEAGAIAASVKDHPDEVIRNHANFILDMLASQRPPKDGRQQQGR